MHTHPSIPITQQLLLQRFELLKQQRAPQAQKGMVLQDTRSPAAVHPSILAQLFSYLKLTPEQCLVLIVGGAVALWHGHYLVSTGLEKRQRALATNNKVERLKTQTIQRIKAGEAEVAEPTTDQPFITE